MKEGKNFSGELSGLLAWDCSFEGIVVFEGVLRIDGIFSGKIICRPGAKGSVIIGPNAKVDVELLIVDNLYVAGDLYGNGPIIALQEAEFEAKSRVEVDKSYAFYSSHITIKEKALFQGNSVMIRHESEEKKADIKSLIFENRYQELQEPFNQNSLLDRIPEPQWAEDVRYAAIDPEKTGP